MDPMTLVLVLVPVLRWMASCSTRFRSLKPRERGPTTARCSLLVDTRSELTVSDLLTRSCRTLLACDVCIDSDARMHSVGAVLVMCWVDGVRLVWGFACCMAPFYLCHAALLVHAQVYAHNASFLLAADNARCLACASGLPDAFDLDYDALDEFLRRIEAMMCVTLALSLIPHASPVTQRSLAPSITPRTPQGGRHHTVRLALAASISQACSRSRHRHILHANRRACM
jgi:hypothetical protein